jgi:dimethylglycine dehydrogenase
MRLEKSWGAWTMDFRPDFTLMESGLDFFVNWNKDFIGKDAALKKKRMAQVNIYQSLRLKQKLMLVGTKR